MSDEKITQEQIIAKVEALAELVGADKRGEVQFAPPEHKGDLNDSEIHVPQEESEGLNEAYSRAFGVKDWGKGLPDTAVVVCFHSDFGVEKLAKALGSIPYVTDVNTGELHVAAKDLDVLGQQLDTVIADTAVDVAVKAAEASGKLPLIFIAEVAERLGQERIARDAERLNQSMSTIIDIAEEGGAPNFADKFRQFQQGTKKEDKGGEGRSGPS